MAGVVDIGSNTIRLSCYEIRDDRTFECVIHKKEVAGLAGYVDERGRMTDEGIERAVDAIEGFKTVISHMDLESIHFFATAAIRNTVNCDEVVSAIRSRTGYEIQVLSGEEEAICDFVGVCGDNSVQKGMVIDIGGGSTEIVSFEDRAVISAESLGIGSLNLFKRHVKNIVPTKDEVAGIKKKVKQVIGGEKSGQKSERAYGVGGSVRSILKIYNEVYGENKDNREMESDKIRKLLSLYETRKSYMVDRMIKAAPERLHTLIPGLVILCTAAGHFKIKKISVSKFGVREGYLIRHVLNRTD